MKEKFLLSTLGGVLILFCLGNNFAQNMNDITWDIYHIKFQIPVTFNVDTKTTSEFSASDDSNYLSVSPKPGSAMSISDMRQALSDWASSSKVYDYCSLKEMDNMNGYRAVYLDGKKSDPDQSTSMMILVHPDYSTIIIYVKLDYKSTAFNTAIKILMSFIPTY